MIHINIQNKWSCYFFFHKNELTLMSRWLNNIDCSYNKIDKAIHIMLSINSGFTYTNYKYRVSIIGISNASSKELWFNTLVHELKHVQSHICSYYGVSESREQSAYLIGYLMLKIISKI